MVPGDLELLIRTLQTAISPVVLISGVGLLVLSMTNRFAMTTGRSRALAKELKSVVNQEDADKIRIQIKILYQRSKLLLITISFALASVFFVSLLIIYLFLNYTLNLNFHYAIGTLFIMSLVSLLISLLLFIKDISLSLNALKLELKDCL